MIPRVESKQVDARPRRLWGAGLVLLLLLPTPQWLAASDLAVQTRQAMTRTVDFLAQAQQPDGSFRSYFCLNPTLTECIPTSATIPTVIVLSGLLAVEDPRTAVLVGRGAKFLQAQMDEEGWLSYFSRNDPQYASQPGELGVTCFVRSVLETLGVSLPPIRHDLAMYQTDDGTFYNFAIPPSEVTAIKASGVANTRHLVIDPAVNAWIFTYLIRHEQAPAALCDYLVRVAQQKQAPGNPPITESPYLFPHALSHAYHQGASCLEPAKTAWQSRLLQQQHPDGGWGNIIDTALAASALLRFGYDGETLDRAIQHLLSRQQPNGSWRRAIRRAHELKPVWHVSEEISTGHVLEALGQYLKR